MKQLFAISVFFVICISSSTVAFGQKSRQRTEKIIQPQAAVVIEAPAAAFTFVGRRLAKQTILVFTLFESKMEQRSLSITVLFPVLV
jgi:hypothetical protein